MDVCHTAEFGEGQAGVESQSPDLLAHAESESPHPSVGLPPDGRLGDRHAVVNDMAVVCDLPEGAGCGCQARFGAGAAK